jgi:hypothetical protein
MLRVFSRSKFVIAQKVVADCAFRSIHITLTMTIFAVPVFDATVVFEDEELFKGKGSAEHWAKRLATEIGSDVTVRKIGTGWALCGAVDGVDCIWGLYGQRLKRRT